MQKQSATAWREANSSRDNRNITAEVRPATTRMPEIVDYPTTVLAQQGRQQHNMDANSTIWTPTAQFGRQQHNMDANNSRVFAKKNGEKLVNKDVKRVTIPHFLSDRFHKFR